MMIFAVYIFNYDSEKVKTQFIPNKNPKSGKEAFLTRELIKEHNIGPGDEVFMVGRFINHEGKKQNTPSVRTGCISMMPHEPVQIDSHRSQESFLVEVRSIPGYSGAPVSVWIPPLSVRPDAKLLNMMPDGPWLMGLDWGHITHREKVKEVKTDRTGGTNKKYEGDTVYVAVSNTSMMGVIPIWKVYDFLKLEYFMNDRNEKDEARKKWYEENKASGVSLDFAADDSKTDEEAEREGDKILKTLLNTPPETHKEMKKK